MTEILNAVPMTGNEGNYQMWIIAAVVVLIAAGIFLFGRSHGKHGNIDDDDDDKNDDK